MPSTDHPTPGGPAAPTPDPVLVLTAMPEEAAPLLARLQDPRALECPLAGVTAAAGHLAGRTVVVATTGIGIAAAAATTTWAVLAHSPRLVINGGSAGGLAADIEVGTVVVGDAFTYSIADATAFGYAPGQVPGGPERFGADGTLSDIAEAAARRAIAAEDTAGGRTTAIRRGLMLSGDAFVTAEIAGPMRERFPGALSADMETTAIARTCAALDVPFLAVRAISDLCGPAADQQFHLELELVAERSAAVVAQVIAAL